jgi:predicted methyltransferase
MKPFLFAAVLALTACASTSGQVTPPDYHAALADPGRPQADRDRDAARKPAELLAFAEVGDGDRVVDFIMGGGYFTRILAGAVGPAGKVYAYQPAEFIGFNADYARQQDEAVAGRANVVPMRDSLRSLAFAEPLDAIITVQNWHDLHLRQSPPGFAAAIARRLYAALKPGGVLLVVDHVANADPNFAVPETLHRIDPAAARAEIESAGFRFDGELSILRNPQDPRTARVFDESIRGRTDQFVYRFRKPG